MIERNRAAPPRVAVPLHEPLADFANRFALSLYDGDWRPVHQDLMRSNNLGNAYIGSDGEVVSLVRRQLQGVLTSGKIETGLSISDQDQGKTRIVYEEDETLPYRWSVRAAFWSDEHNFEKIDWTSSSVALTPDDVFNVSEKRTLAQLYKEPTPTINSKVFVVDSLRSLNFVVPNDLPSDANIKKYMTYADIILREAQAVGWRFVALNAQEPQRYGSIQNLIAAITDYLDSSNLKIPSDKTLREVARKILRQFTDLKAGKRHSTMRVFVNSTPADRAKPDIELF